MAVRAAGVQFAALSDTATTFTLNAVDDLMALLPLGSPRAAVQCCARARAVLRCPWTPAGPTRAEAAALLLEVAGVCKRARVVLVVVVDVASLSARAIAPLRG